MTITVKAAREALEAAHLAYTKADIEHPTATHIAKEALTHARHEYFSACAEFVERLKYTDDLAEVQNRLIAQGIWP